MIKALENEPDGFTAVMQPGGRIDMPNGDVLQVEWDGDTAVLTVDGYGHDDAAVRMPREVAALVGSWLIPPEVAAAATGNLHQPPPVSA